jgi:hypothetical protein
MRQWNLKSGDPLTLTLVSDARLAPGDYFDDQIWELKIGGGEPEAMALQTTYGLRAKDMRLFPRFTLGETSRTDPDTFYQSPVVKVVFPNFIAVTFSPFPGIDISIEYWIPQPHAIGSRLQVINNGVTDRKFLVEFIGQLSSIDGQRMTTLEIQATTILYGYTGNLSPVVFMTGNPKAGQGPYPSLAQKMEMAPNDSRQFIVIHSALADREASFNLARSIAAQKWDAEKSRIEMLNAGQVEVYTGNTDWDTAFMLAQKSAIGLLIGKRLSQGVDELNNSFLPHTSFVLSRQPDQGFSLRGDGSDYSHLWNGQTPMEARYLASLILPFWPDGAQGLIQNYLAIQEADGFIDWKPGMVGQRSRLLATPLLADLTWRIFEVTGRVAFLEEAYPKLSNFLKIWFSHSHDRDGDGIPEWDHLLQTGLDDHPIFSDWHTWSMGVDISTAECLSLCAFLHNECNALIRIAKLLGYEQDVSMWESRANAMKAAIEAAWSDEDNAYFNWDRDTHHSTRGELILEGKGSGIVEIRREFAEPIRPFITIRTEETARRRPVIFLHGTGSSGNPRVERINDDQINWIPGLGKLTCKYVYASLSRIEVRGLEQEDRFTVQSVGFDYQDLSNLLPLWAGIPSSKRAELLINETILNPRKFWHANGLPICINSSETNGVTVCGMVHLPWNGLICEGLLRYGYREEAAELVSRIMQTVIQTLKREQAFRRYYHADLHQCVGERNALSGLAPLGLFLETLGLQLISPTRISLSGKNPFPWPVTVKYRGLTIMRQQGKTTVIFPDGQVIEIDDPTDESATPRIVSLETDEI